MKNEKLVHGMTLFHEWNGIDDWLPWTYRAFHSPKDYSNKRVLSHTADRLAITFNEISADIRKLWVS